MLLQTTRINNVVSIMHAVKENIQNIVLKPTDILLWNMKTSQPAC